MHPIVHEPYRSDYEAGFKVGVQVDKNEFNK